MFLRVIVSIIMFLFVSANQISMVPAMTFDVDGADIKPVKANVYEITLNFDGGIEGLSESDDGTYFYDVDSNPCVGWFDLDGNRYFLDENGKATVGWLEKDGIKYFFNSSGIMQIGFVDVDDKTFYFDQTGAQHVGFLFLDDSTYYFDRSSGLSKGWVEDHGKKYYFDADGHMVTDWLETEDGLYYFSIEDGHMWTGWLTSGDVRYYLNDDGLLVTGWQTINDIVYYFDDNGVQQTGETYVSSDDATYYLYKDGGYAMDTVEDGKYYTGSGTLCSEWYSSDTYIHNGITTSLCDNYGGYGRLYIPDVGINVALYQIGYYDNVDAQAVVDADDSAVYMTGWGATPFIGDHTNQGFSGIRSCGSGTKAFIRHGGNTYVYSCYYVGGGTNDGYDVYDWNGINVWDHGSDDIAMYTCNGNWQNVSIVLFSLVEVL